MKNITITWKAFGEPTSVQFDLDTHDSAQTLCERVFRDTNLYQGSIWDIVEPILPENRTHTALSVGDEVAVDGKVFRCASIGWEELVSQ